MTASYLIVCESVHMNQPIRECGSLCRDLYAVIIYVNKARDRSRQRLGEVDVR